MQTLAQGKYIKVIDPESNVTITGLKLLKVTMTCACCNHDIQGFEIMSDRLSEWEDKIKNEKKFQPLCRPCVKAHKKWHPEKEQLNEALKVIKEANESYENNDLFSFGYWYPKLLAALNHKEETKGEI